MTLKARTELLRLALPIVVTNATLAAMQLTDGLILGKLGVQELAAITPAGILVFLLASFGYGFFTSVTTFASQACGSGSPHEASRFAWQSIFLSIAFGGLLLVCLWPFSNAIFSLFASSPELRNLEVQYFRYGLFTIPPEFIATALSAYFFGVGRPWIVCLVSVIGVAANAILSIALVHGYFGLPELGFRGAPIGTLIATAATAIALLGAFLGPLERAKRNSTVASVSAGRMRKLLRVGLPAGGQSAFDTLSWGVILSWLISQFPDEQLAASSILIRCLQLSFLPSEGVGAALVAKVGESIGADRQERALIYARVSIRIIATYMCVVGILLWVFRFPLLGLFTHSPEVVVAGASAMIFVSFFQIFDAMNINYIHALHGAGDTRWAFVVNGILSGLVLLGGGLLVIRFANHWGASGVWAVAALYVMLQGLLFRARWKSGRWRLIGNLT